VRLLLDEHIPQGVADGLADLGHDAVAVSRRPLLRGTADAALLAAASAEDRTLVTRDVADFSRLAARLVVRGEAHAGVVLLSGNAFSPARAGIAHMTEALHALAVANPGGELGDRVVWLEPAAGDAGRR
jgi:predicted nuclease of predicted toxin-antitoxin system